MTILEAILWLGYMIGCCSSAHIASPEYICSRGSSDGDLGQCTNQQYIGLSKILLNYFGVGSGWSNGWGV